MLTARISKLDPESIIDPADMAWLCRRIGEPLQVLSVNYTPDTGQLFSVTVLKYAKPQTKVITIFMYLNNTELTLEGDLQ